MKPRALMQAGRERSQGRPGAPGFQIQDPQLPLGGVEWEGHGGGGQQHFPGQEFEDFHKGRVVNGKARVDLKLPPPLPRDLCPSC